MQNNNEDVSRHDEITPTYSLTVEEAADIFTQAGVAKSPRTISRNCEDGTLLCTKADTLNNWKYMVDRSSVDRRIAELKNVIKISVRHDTSSHDETHQDTSRRDEPRHDTSSHNSTHPDDDYVQKLEAQIKGLEIDKAVRDLSVQFLEKQLAKKEEREKTYIEQLITQSRLIGNLEQQLLLLSPGKTSEPHVTPMTEVPPPKIEHAAIEIPSSDVRTVENLEREISEQSVQ